MAGIPHDHYEPKTGFEKWLHARLPIVSLIYDTITIPTPKNLNWMWIWGIVLAFCLVMQSVTGIVLVTPAHIMPEWYYLPFYAILRAFTAQTSAVKARRMA